MGMVAEGSGPGQVRIVRSVGGRSCSATAIPANAPMYDSATRFRRHPGGPGVQSRRFCGCFRAWRELLVQQENACPPVPGSTRVPISKPACPSVRAARRACNGPRVKANLRLLRCSTAIALHPLVAPRESMRHESRRSIPAPVAQLDRVLASEAKGHRFESCRARQSLDNGVLRGSEDPSGRRHGRPRQRHGRGRVPGRRKGSTRRESLRRGRPVRGWRQRQRVD